MENQLNSLILQWRLQGCLNTSPTPFFQQFNLEEEKNWNWIFAPVKTLFSFYFLCQENKLSFQRRQYFTHKHHFFRKILFQSFQFAHDSILRKPDFKPFLHLIVWYLRQSAHLSRFFVVVRLIGQISHYCSW